MLPMEITFPNQTLKRFLRKSNTISPPLRGERVEVVVKRADVDDVVLNDGRGSDGAARLEFPAEPAVGCLQHVQMPIHGADIDGAFVNGLQCPAF